MLHNTNASEVRDNIMREKKIFFVDMHSFLNVIFLNTCMSTGLMLLYSSIASHNFISQLF